MSDVGCFVEMCVMALAAAVFGFAVFVCGMLWWELAYGAWSDCSRTVKCLGTAGLLALVSGILCAAVCAFNAYAGARVRSSMHRREK